MITRAVLSAVPHRFSIGRIDMTTTTMKSLLVLALLSAPVLAAEPAKQPSTKPAVELPKVEVPDNLTGAQLATRAQQAFNRGEYALALPLLRKVAAESENQPAKLASLMER